MPFDASDRSQGDHTRQSVREFPLGEGTPDSTPDEYRDGVQAHVSNTGTAPAIVSISDIHGYLDAARSALLILSDHPNYDPVVVQDDDGRLHWAGNDYVLVFNGDLIDRGPANVETLQMVQRLVDEAPAGRVRVTLGNHEMGVLTPSLFMWERWFSGQVSADGRRSLVNAILDGHVVAAYRGYNVTYAHAGQGREYDIASANDGLLDAATQLRGLIGGGADAHTQRQIVEDNPLVLGIGEPHPKGADAGLVWVDFQHLPPDAPPQVVGHTRHETVTRKGSLVCQNVIRETVDSPGGEAILVETPDALTVLSRGRDGSVSQRRLAI